jgi:hypothetical protein
MVRPYLCKGSELNQKYTSYGKIYIRDGRTTHMVSHDYNELRGTNVWRWYKQTIDDATIFNDSDCEGPVYVCALEGDNILAPKDYIGGYHGSEIMENVALFIDG